MGFWSKLIELLNFRHRLPSPSPPPRPTPDSVAEALLMEINRRRTARGLQPVIPDQRIDVTAQDWANSIADQDLLSHGDAAHRLAGVYPGLPWGEDIAMAASPTEVVSMWEGDPLHARILFGNYDHVGVGIALSRTGWSYWVADFVLLSSRVGSYKV